MTNATPSQLAKQIELYNAEAKALSKFFNCPNLSKIFAAFPQSNIDPLDCAYLKNHLNNTIADISAQRILLEHELETRINKTA